MMSVNTFDGMYWARPINSKKFHVFKNGMSVCNKWMMLGKDEASSVDVTGKETLSRDDCKACFKKMNLMVNR